MDEAPKRGLTDPSAAAIEAKRIEQERIARRAKMAEEKKRMEEEKALHGDDKNWKIRKIVVAAMEEMEPVESNPHYTSSSMTDRILVCVRTRPLLQKDIDAKDFKILSFRGDRGLTLHDVKKNKDLSLRLDNYQYTFDFVFDDDVGSESVYKKTLMPMIDSIFSSNKKISMFAYGQTGSGKTYTMMSIFQQSIQDMFAGLESQELYASLNLTITVSFYEVYQGKIFDLFSNRNEIDVMEDKDGNINLRGLSEIPVRTPDDVLVMLNKGQKYRSSRATEMNDTSSRSHAILQVVLRNTEGDEHGRLTLIDLAGSEKGSDTPGSDKQTRGEAAEINKSLLTLKECIRALNEGSSHTPFRGSKLTMILRDSLIGESSRAIMVACLAPGYSATEATLNTLRYADRLKTASEDADNAVVSEEELARLAQLEELKKKRDRDDKVFGNLAKPAASKTGGMAAPKSGIQAPSPAKSAPAPAPAAKQAAPAAKPASAPTPAPKPTTPQKVGSSGSITGIAQPKQIPTASSPATGIARKTSTGGSSSVSAAHVPQTPVYVAPTPTAPAPSRTATVPVTTHDLNEWFVLIGIPEAESAEYTQKLKAEGFDDLDSLHDVTEADLETLGVKLGHRRKIMRCFQDLAWS